MTMQTQPGNRGGRGSAGFTILEVIMVVLIIGVLFFVLGVPFSTYRNVQLDGAADKLVADIRYCQQLAMNNNGVYAVVFEPASSRYTLKFFNGTSLVDIPDPLTHVSPARTTYGTGEYEGLSLTSASFNGGQELRFTARGIPQDGTNTNLASAGTAVISGSAGTVTVSVTPDTGRVSRT